MMQNNVRPLWQNAGFIFLMMTAFFAALVSLNLGNEVSAQGLAVGTPTPTPTDPSWLGFIAARDALEEERSIDLTYIRDYSFDQSQWVDGIETCNAEAEESDLFFGWTYTIISVTNQTYEVRVAFDLSVIVVCDQVTVPAEATADPNATPIAGLPTPIAGSASVGGFELGGHVVGLSATTVTSMRQSRMTWVKRQYRYNLGDSGQAVAGLIAEARASGFKILIAAVGNPAQMTDYNAYIASFATFTGEVAAAGADAIEVWNEPNIDREWPNGRVNGGTYTQMLAVSYNAIKARNANTIVISGAPAPTGFFGTAGCTAQGCNDDVFMQQMAQAGAARYMDCVGLHYNEGIVSPATNSGDPRGNYPTYYYSSMLARGYGLFGGKPVCFTELGYLTPVGYGPLPGAFAWAIDTSLDEHTTWLADAVSRSAQSGRVRLVIVWNIDFRVYDSDPQAGYAIIRADSSCPACAALGRVMGGS